MLVDPPVGPKNWRAELLTWLPIIVGLAVFYVPSLVDLFGGIWSSDEQMHGPIVLGISCWLIYRNWPMMMAASADARPSHIGWPIFVFGLLLYIVGRSQGILVFETGSAIWLLIGITLLSRGVAALKTQWFALFARGAAMVKLVPPEATAASMIVFE